MDYINDLVSVVIPTHNRSELVVRAIRSAFSQTYKKIEIIVVSDGYDQKTEDAMKQYNSSIFKFISYDKPLGGNHARNMGIKASKGEWVAFLDDDDEWLNNKISLQIELSKIDKDIGLICTAFNSIDDETGRVSFFCPTAKKDASIQILKTNCIGSTTTAMVKHILLDDVGLFDEKLFARQDYDLWIRLCQITKVGIVEIPCVNYHNLATNNQISWDYKKYQHAAEYMNNKYFELFEKKLSKKEIKTILCNEKLSISRKAFKANNRSMCRKFAIESLKIRFTIKGILHFFASFFSYKLVQRFYEKN